MSTTSSDKPVPKGKQKKRDNSVYSGNQKRKLDWEYTIRELPWTENQKRLIQLIQDKNTKCVLVSGPAGSSKTIVAVYCMLSLLHEKRIGDITYIRTPVESSSFGLGFMPGDSNDKMEPYMVPFREKLEELLNKATVDKLEMEGRIGVQVTNFLRGAHFTGKGIIVDECQSVPMKELQTIMTRMGEFCKMVMCGDYKQSDLKRAQARDYQNLVGMFDTEESRSKGIHVFHFTKDDIMRSEFVRYVVDVFERHGYLES